MDIEYYIVKNIPWNKLPPEVQSVIVNQFLFHFKTFHHHHLFFFHSLSIIPMNMPKKLKNIQL